MSRLKSKPVVSAKSIQVPIRFGSSRGIAALIGLMLSLASTALMAEQATLKSAAQQAILTNPEVLARYHAFRASEGELEAVTSSLLPHLDFIASKGKEDRHDPLFTGQFSEYSRSLQLTQLLWDGMGSWYQKRQFDHARMVRLFEFFDASESAALEVARAYFDVLRYRKLVELAEDNYVQHRSVYEQIEARVKAGVGRRVDFEQASGRLALAESNLIVEISNLHDVSARYQRIVGIPPAEVLETPNLLSEGIPDSVKLALEKTYSLNPQVRAAVENVRASAYARDARRGAYQPKVEFRLREDRGSDLNGYVGQTRNQVAEVLLNFNIFNGFGDVGRVSQATEQYNTARDQRDKACRDVRQTLEIAYNDVRKLVEQKNYLEQHRLSVEKARDAYRKQFDIGQRSLLDLLDTENELFQARRAEANAELDLATAYARVHGGTGNILSVLGLSAVDNDLTTESKDWNLGEETPERCPPEPVVTYVADKSQLNDRASEMTRDKVKAMLDAIAARREAAGGDAVSVDVVPNPTSANRLAETAVASAMSNWLVAWGNGDVAAYLSSYAPSFIPVDGRSHDAWVAARKVAVGKAKSVKPEITLSGQHVEFKDATHAIVRFHQSYASPSFADETEKVLEWQLFDGRWLIVRELASPALPKSGVDQEKKPVTQGALPATNIPRMGSVTDAINVWSSAWANSDTSAFDVRYSKDFVSSNGISRDEWINQEMRKSAFSRSKGIQMEVSDIAQSPIDVSHVKVTLTQQYQSTGYSRKVNKLLVLEKTAGDWKIVSEGIASMPVSISEPQRAAVSLISLPMPPEANLPVASPATY